MIPDPGVLSSAGDHKASFIIVDKDGASNTFTFLVLVGNESTTSSQDFQLHSEISINATEFGEIILENPGGAGIFGIEIDFGDGSDLVSFTVSADFQKRATTTVYKIAFDIHTSHSLFS